jgi:hypothetical protein
MAESLTFEAARDLLRESERTRTPLTTEQLDACSAALFRRTEEKIEEAKRSQDQDKLARILIMLVKLRNQSEDFEDEAG